MISIKIYKGMICTGKITLCVYKDNLETLTER